MANATGLGGTVTALGLTNFTVGSWNFVSITGYEETVQALDNTSLGSTGFMEAVGASLADPSEVTVTVYWNYSEASTFSGNLTVGESATFTFSLPTRASGTGGSISGTAFITSVSPPDHTPNDRSIGTFTLKFDGGMGPVYTAHT